MLASENVRNAHGVASNVAIALVCKVYISFRVFFVGVCFNRIFSVNDTTPKSQKPMELIWSLARVHGGDVNAQKTNGRNKRKMNTKNQKMKINQTTQTNRTMFHDWELASKENTKNQNPMKPIWCAIYLACL